MHLLLIMMSFTLFRGGEACSQISDHSEFLQLARVYLKHGQFTNAEKCFLSALQTIPADDAPERASILRQLGDVYVSLDEISRAEPVYLESLRIYKRNADRLDTVILMRDLGLTYAIEYRERDAVEILQRAMKAARDLPGPRIDLIARLLNDLGIAYRRLGQFKKADKYFEEAAGLISRAGTSIVDEEILTTCGAILLVQGRYVKAEEFLKRALAVRQLRLGPSHPDLSMTLALLGDLYLRTGQFGQAQDYYRQAIRLIEADPLEFNTRIARLLYSLSVAYRTAGQEADADFSLSEAAAIALNNLDKHDMPAIVEEYLTNLEKAGKTKQASDLRNAVKRSRAASSLVVDAFRRF